MTVIERKNKVASSLTKACETCKEYLKQVEEQFSQIFGGEAVAETREMVAALATELADLSERSKRMQDEVKAVSSEGSADEVKKACAALAFIEEQAKDTEFLKSWRGLAKRVGKFLKTAEKSASTKLASEAKARCVFGPGL